MIPVDTADLAVYAGTHEGRTGKNNEDRYGISTYQVNESDGTLALFAVVADGVGGHQAGEIAAEMAVEIITRTVGESDAQHPVETLKLAIVKASQAIRDQASSLPSQRGMGSTCACVWVIGDRLYTASVGDSRIYLIRDKTIRQLTTDHTWVQEAVDYGALTPDQARNHPNVHVIRRYLGSEKPVVPDVRLKMREDESDTRAERNQGAQLRTGDVLLLCTDGLTDLVHDDEILAALQTNHVEAAVPYLINLANHRGGRDNTTVVAYAYVLPESLAQRKRGRQAVLMACVGLLFLLAVALLTAIWLGWYFTRPFTTPTPVGIMLGL